MRSAPLLLALAIALAACQNPDENQAYAERMEHEHADDAPVASAAVSGPDTLNVTGEDVVYATVGGVEVTGYLIRPVDVEGSLPGVIVIHEWWGLNDNIRAMAERIAGLGFTALAVDLYGGRMATTPEEASRYMGEAMENEGALTDNLIQAYRYLAEEKLAPRVGSIGWCFGGGWSLRTAIALPDELDAAVIYYGQPETDPEHLAPLEMPILGLFGREDRGIPESEVLAFAEVLDELGKDADITIYPNADHAFANPSGGRYNEEAAEDAWDRVVAFLREHLGP